ncbi:hypothetical protein C0J52_18628 [Blattella germanica]|nr:hypothetical protein C0J52_18628 [Blattella germanica]
MDQFGKRAELRPIPEQESAPWFGRKAPPLSNDDWTRQDKTRRSASQTINPVAKESDNTVDLLSYMLNWYCPDVLLAKILGNYHMTKAGDPDIDKSNKHHIRILLHFQDLKFDKHINEN